MLAAMSSLIRAQLCSLLSRFTTLSYGRQQNRLPTCFYVLNQRLKVASPLVQRAFLKSFDFIKLVSLEPADVKEAARRAWDDFEDCLVAVAAEKIGADFIITRDAKGFSQSKIKALDADAFLGWMRQKRGRSYAEMRVTREMIEEACRRASFDA